MSQDWLQMDEATAQECSRTLWEKMRSNDEGHRKQAADVAEDITRTMILEEGFYRQIMQPRVLAPSEFMRDWRTKHPVKVVDLEPYGAAATTVPIGGAPMSLYMESSRYPVAMRRYAARKYYADVADLITDKVDVRQILGDKAVKNLSAEEDLQFVTALYACFGGEGAVVAATQIVQNRHVPGSIGDKDAYIEGTRTIESSPNGLNTKTILLNNLTVLDLKRFSVFEVGEEFVAEVTRKGYTRKEFQGHTLVVTIKKGLVPNGVTFHFTDVGFIGKAYMVEDVVLHVQRDGHQVTFYPTVYGGAAIGNVAGVARTRFG